MKGKQSEGEKMETRHKEVAEAVLRLTKKARTSKEVSQAKLEYAIANASGIPDGEYNLFPSFRNSRCCKTAFFVSLKKTNLPYRGNTDVDYFDEDIFDFAIRRLLRHMQGSCAGITETAVLITDVWNSQIYDEWASNLNVVASHAKLVVYLLMGDKVNEIPIG